MKRVLIIADTPFMRETLKMMLENSEFQVAGEAVNPRTGVKMYDELKPGLVVCDIFIPERGFLKALKEIIRLDAKTNIVIIASLGQEQVVKQALFCGAKTFILKPFKKEHFIQTLTNTVMKTKSAGSQNN